MAADWGRKLAPRAGAAFLSDFEVGDRGLKVDAGLIIDLGDDAAKFKAAVFVELAKMLDDVRVPHEATEVDGFLLVTVRLDEGTPPISFGMKDSLFSETKAQGASVVRFFTDEKVITERYWSEE